MTPGPTRRRVRKAVIPAAGRGTRMRPFSWVVPKELVPLGSTPALHFVLQEALRAGLKEIALVTRPEKALLAAYVARLVREEGFEDLDVTCIEQPEPLGLAEALALCEPFAEGEPFALLLPDNVLLAPEHDLAVMLDLHEATGRHVVGVIELGEEESGQYGNSGRFLGQETETGVWRIDRLEPKGEGRLVIPPGERVRRTCGRYVCAPDLFERIESLRGSIEGEYSEVPVYRRIAEEGGLAGVRLPMPLFDVGHPAGVLAASAWIGESGGPSNPYTETNPEERRS